MASSRDDFIIAIRSAFLKKSTKQKFSLLTLIFFSIFIIVLSSFDLKAVRFTKSIIKEIVYRSSFIVSIPENFIISTYLNLSEYTNYYKEFTKTKEELDNLKSELVFLIRISIKKNVKAVAHKRELSFLFDFFLGLIITFDFGYGLFISW